MSAPDKHRDQPLRSVDEWDDFISRDVYPEAQGAQANYRNREKPAEEYRQFQSDEKPGVKEFYRQHHREQTVKLVQKKKEQFLPVGGRRQMPLLESLQFLNTLVDESDPDLDLDQLQHLLQTAEAIRADGREDWFVLAGLLHDLGKVLCLFGEPQWAVVGDTHPVGCQFSDKIVYSEFFRENPDASSANYATKLGIYTANCGLRNVEMTWGHDEYAYHVVGKYLPEPAQYMIRYHSFYAWHREGEYDWLCDETDRAMLPWVREFNQYDLYSKSPEPPDWGQLADYYLNLAAKYLPERIAF